VSGWNTYSSPADRTRRRQRGAIRRGEWGFAPRAKRVPFSVTPGRRSLRRSLRLFASPRPRSLNRKVRKGRKGFSVPLLPRHSFLSFLCLLRVLCVSGCCLLQRLGRARARIIAPTARLRQVVSPCRLLLLTGEEVRARCLDEVVDGSNLRRVEARNRRGAGMCHGRSCRRA